MTEVLQDPNDATRFSEFDSKFQIPVVINVAHHEVHEGNSYIVDEVVDAASLALAFYVPTGTKRAHLIFQWAAESKAHIEIYEGRTWNTGTGSKIVIYNRDRNSSNISQMEEDTTGAFVASMGVVKDPTGQAGGTVIHNEYAWSDKKETNRNRDVSEFILKNNETYVVLLTSDDGAKGLHIALHWYEHTDN